MRLAVLGGRREAEAGRWLSGRGVELVSVADAEAVLLPALGPGPAELDALRRVGPAVPVLVGRGGERLRAMGLRAYEYGGRDDYQAANAVPTAEAAIWEAGRMAERTVAGARCLVVGFGYCGAAIAQRLVHLGARVAVVARREDSRVAAQATGCDTYPVDGLQAAAADRELVWNTVPAPLLDRAFLAALPSGAVVLDIASAPGGTDFEAAAALGVRAELAGALPARHLPRTAGELIARTILRILAELGG